ncbi:hypothetical protein CHLRE_10g437650v5 [Chlamydomonas reinhardtii]|uniref:Uncharacterized protein n=1 Tax=Chlamydomonas reinhardtii TaxID=3055 RepID=A0A2K3DAA7_CHLRE|nr:uncharacterized protein CHLRE_10g437650v5 [Chlamydomonas reinhardtii]PNW77461.1 hypothetical protein CHLRE_10g437650v5 [Chlamydomonas reinhardtii]
MAVVGLMLTYAVGIEQRQRKAGAAEAAAAGAGEAAPLFFDPPLHQAASAPRLAWCGLVARPLALGDWPWLVMCIDEVALAALLTLLWATAAYRRPNSRLWAYWCRHRDWLISLHVPMAVTVLPLAAFWVALPPPLWRQAGAGAYVAAVASRPLADVVYVTLTSAFLPVRSSLTAAAAAGHVVAMLAISRHVVPHLPLYIRGGSSTGSTGAAVAAPSPPPPLLHELPFPYQLLIAACYVVAPLLLSLGAERRMAHSYHRYCGHSTSRSSSGRNHSAGRGGSSSSSSAAKDTGEHANGFNVAAVAKAAAEPGPLQSMSCGSEDIDRSGSSAAGGSHEPLVAAAAMTGTAQPQPQVQPLCAATQPAARVRVLSSSSPHAAAAVAPSAMLAAQPPSPPQPERPVLRGVLVSRAREVAGPATPTAAPHSRTALPAYHGLTRCALLSVKLQTHPGTFESYSQRLMQATPAIAAASQETCAGGFTQALVVRGCVQLIMWTRTPVAAAGGAVSAPEQPQQPPLDARLLSQLLPDGDQVGGLAVQQQQAAVAAAAGGSVAVQLLHLTPPVLPLPGGPTASDATAPPPEPLRLRLFSPGPQRARLLVVGSSSTEAAAAATAAGGLRPQRVFAELQVQLCGGDQELELGGEVLRQLLLMACVEAEAPTGCSRALQLLLMPPVHDGDEELVEAAEGSAGEVMPPPPLLHFSAPLLVLPAAAAVELCGLWEQVAAEAGGDAAAAHAHLQPLLSDLAYVLEAAETEELPAAAEGAGSDAAADAELGFAMASADLMSYFLRACLPAAAALLRRPGGSCCTSAMANSTPERDVVTTPCNATARAAGTERAHAAATASRTVGHAAVPNAATVAEPGVLPEAAAAVAFARPPYSTAEHAQVAGEEREQILAALPASLSGCDSSDSSGGSSCGCMGAPPASATACSCGDISSTPTSSASALVNAAEAAAPNKGIQEAAAAPTAAAADGPHGRSAVTFRDLFFGFSPPQLETQFAAWRAVRLARAAPFVLLITLQPYLLGTLRTLREGYAHTGAQVTGLALQWLSDSVPYAVLLTRLRHAPRAVGASDSHALQPRLAEASRANPAGCSSSGGASTSGASDSCTRPSAATASARLRHAPAVGAPNSASVPSTGDGLAPSAAAAEAALIAAVGAYETAAAYAAPACFCVAVLLAHIGILASNDSFVGDIRSVWLIVFYRAVVLALALPLPLRRVVPVAGRREAAVVAALLHTAGTALVLGLTQPRWSMLGLAATGGLTWLLATVVVGVRDWAARRRFLQQRAARVPALKLASHAASER